jgi:hypothetical protein
MENLLKYGKSDVMISAGYSKMRNAGSSEVMPVNHWVRGSSPCWGAIRCEKGAHFAMTPFSYPSIDSGSRAKSRDSWPTADRFLKSKSFCIEWSGLPNHKIRPACFHCI